MKHYEDRPKQEVVAYTCDVCGRHMGTGMDAEDHGLEALEMLHWENRGGYGSIIGDGEEMSLDLCQYCIVELLGKVIKYHGNAYWPKDFDQMEFGSGQPPIDPSQLLD